MPAKTTRRRRPPLISLVVLAMVPIVATCSAFVCRPPRPLTTSELGTLYAFRASAGPSLVCAGDPVRVTWAMTATPVWGEDPLCTTEEECAGRLTAPIASVAVDNSPPGDLFAGAPVAATELEGERTVTPATDVTIRVRGSLQGRVQASSVVREFPITVIGEEVVEFRQPLIGEGACIDGDTRAPGWLGPAIDRETLLGEDVVVEEICNLTPFDPVNALVRWDSGPDREISLARGACQSLVSAGGPAARRIQRIVTTVLDPTALDRASCPPRSEEPVVGQPMLPDRPPRDYVLELAVRCLAEP